MDSFEFMRKSFQNYQFFLIIFGRIWVVSQHWEGQDIESLAYIRTGSVVQIKHGVTTPQKQRKKISSQSQEKQKPRKKNPERCVYSTGCDTRQTLKTGLLWKMPHPGAIEPTTPHFVLGASPPMGKNFKHYKIGGKQGCSMLQESLDTLPS